MTNEVFVGEIEIIIVWQKMLLYGGERTNFFSRYQEIHEMFNEENMLVLILSSPVDLYDMSR